MHAERHSERAFSLTEVLVALVVLAVATTVGLVLFDAARKLFNRGENAAENQQAVRMAFNKLASDLRMAGFNHNPDGSKTRPDEQIEAAYDTAIVIRADFDAEDPTASTTPESALAGGVFPAVSTGNDEIVTYVLAKPGGSSAGTLTFEADVAESTRDADVETISIPRIALVQNDPPYTLYRITLNNDATTFGSNGFIVRTPLAENVRSLTFRYYDQAGSVINSAFDLGATADDIGGDDAQNSKTLRSTIRRIGLELVGMTRDPDLGWVDANDTNPATQEFHKFGLTGVITPRNLGLVGQKDLGQN